MSRFSECLPEETRSHFTLMQSHRSKQIALEYDQNAKAMKAQAAARGLYKSGFMLRQLMELLQKHSRALATGLCDDALEICKMYDVPLTANLKACLIDACEQLLESKHKHSMQTMTTEIAKIQAPAGAEAAVRSQMETSRLSPMIEIRLRIEKAYMEERKARMRVEEEKSVKGNNTQNITQYGGVLNTSMFGDVNTTTTINYSEIASDLEKLRIQFEALGTLEGARYAAMMEEAKAAATAKDESKIVSILKKVSGAAWDVAKPLIGAALLQLAHAHHIPGL